MKRLIALCLSCMLLLSCLPGTAFAKAKQMEPGVPEWNEETVRQYMLDYIEGNDMERLWGYYDLQIRRYMPIQAYKAFLYELEFMTGDFVSLGSYRCFVEPEQQTKTHVLHLCMEKQDLDVYFTHKDKEDDWEVMGLEFVPAEKEQPVTDDMLVDSNAKQVYTEEAVTVGSEPYLLDGVLSIPTKQSADGKLPVCLLLHDFGALDKDHTVGVTKFFADLAEDFAKLGIATLRYDKRTFAYPDSAPESVAEEVVDDAVSALNLLLEDERFTNVFILGVGLGGTEAARVASAAQSLPKGLIVVGASPDSLLDQVFAVEKANLASLPKEEATAIKNTVRNLVKGTEEKARETELFGRNAYYYWEDAQYSASKLIKKLRLPLLYVQGKGDTGLSLDDGKENFKKDVGTNTKYTQYKTIRNVNRLLMRDLSVGEDGKSQFSVEAHVDMMVVRDLAEWILTFE